LPAPAAGAAANVWENSEFPQEYPRGRRHHDGGDDAEKEPGAYGGEPPGMLNGRHYVAEDDEVDEAEEDGYDAVAWNEPEAVRLRLMGVCIVG
jgi:hypothetical protein